MITADCTIDQSQLTTECWDLQIFGKEKCVTCPEHGRRSCNGQSILRLGRNRKGLTVPLQEGGQLVRITRSRETVDFFGED